MKPEKSIMAKQKRLNLILIAVGILCLLLYGLGYLGFTLKAKHLPAWCQYLPTRTSSQAAFLFGLFGIVTVLTILVINSRWFKSKFGGFKNQEGDVTRKRKRLNIALIIIAVLCPFLFGLGSIGSIIGAFMAEGKLVWWEHLFIILSVSVVSCAGLVGFASALTLLLINRKRFKTVFAWFGLLLLLLVNLCLSAPSLALVSKCSKARYLYPMEFRPSIGEEENGYYKMTHNDWEFIFLLRKPMYISFFRTDVADRNIAYLSENRNISANLYIREFRFHSCPNITDGVVQSLARFPRLKKIFLGDNPQLKDFDFSALAGLKKLETIGLYKAGNLSAESLGSIAKLPRLKELKLTECPQADDEVLAKIAGLKNLRCVELKDCEKITDAGIAELSNLRYLKSLTIHGCPSVTSEGVNRIRNGLPQCEIDWKDRSAKN